MLRFRLTIVALVGWLFLFYNIERIHEPLNIASFVYVLSALGSALLIVVGGQHNRLIATCFASVVLLLVLKSHWNYPIVHAALPITITEVVAMTVTFALASRLAEGVQGFEEGAFQLTMAQERNSFEQEQTEMYGEVRRAREFQRPLTVAYIRGDTREFEKAMHPLIVQSQRAAAERYARAKVADAIGEQLRDCDMFALHDGGYVLVLPEADRDNAELLLERVKRSLSEQFNLDVEAGVASLPDEQVTFSGLLDHAMTRARSVDAGDGVDRGAADAQAKNVSENNPEPTVQTTPDVAEANSAMSNSAAPHSAMLASGGTARGISQGSSRRIFDPTLAITLNVSGAPHNVDRYLEQLRTQFGDRWEPQFNGAAAAIVLDVDLTDQSIAPPEAAVAMGGDWFADSQLFRRAGEGWLRLERRDGDRWALTRTAGAEGCFTIEQAMFRISCLRGGGLPLHASVGRLHEVGMAALGSAESGKTAVLLALLELGGQWICDDEAYCASDLTTAYGTASEIHVKQRYLAQLPELSRRVRRKDRWNQRFSTAARRLAGGASLVPAVPKPVRRRLKRMADGQVSTPMSPPGRLPASSIDVALIVTSGRAPQLEPLDPVTWSTRAAEVLWPEVRDVHELHRCMQAATGGELIGDESADEQRLRDRMLDFALNKQTFQLIRSPETPLEHLSKLLAAMWDDIALERAAQQQEAVRSQPAL